MLKKLAITVRFPDFRLKALSWRLEEYFAGIGDFEELEEVRISVSPEALYWENSLEEFVDIYTLGADEIVRDCVGSSGVLEESYTLAQAFVEIRKALPEKCEVHFQFDNVGMPDLANYVSDRVLVAEVLTKFNCTLDLLWRSVVSSADSKQQE
jgi:hypothetical protein